MALIRYSREELLRFKGSPLAQKPDGLPSIEQWMESSDQAQRMRRTQGSRGDEHVTNNENGQQRPSLLGMKPLHRTTSAHSEDIGLGPSKPTFTSASRIKTLADISDKGANDDDSLGKDRTKDRMNLGGMGRFGRDKDNDRLRDRNGATNGRQEGESWNTARSRKSLGVSEEGDRVQKNGERDRERWRPEADTDANADAVRRNGMARARFEQPWGREDSVAKEGDGSKLGAARTGWRDRERGAGRQWVNQPVESDPEWMDSQTNDEKKKVHTQEDFQKWKERMKAGNAAAEEKTEPEEPLQVPKENAAKPSKPVTPLAIEGGQEQWFGKWGDMKKPDSTTPDSTPASKPQQTKAKASRFKGFFAPAETPAAADSPTVPPDTVPTAAPSSPPPSAASNDEDRAGFDRILSMLSGTTLGAQSPQPQLTAGPKQLDFFGSGAKPSAPPGLSQHRMDGLDPGRVNLPRSLEERAAFVDAALAPRAAQAEPKPKQLFPFSLAEQGLDAGHTSRPEFEAFGGGRLEEPTPRKDTIHDVLNTQRLHGQPGPQPLGLDNNRQFLLDLMSQTRGPASQPPNPNLIPLQPRSNPLDALSSVERSTRRMPDSEDILPQYRQTTQDGIREMLARRQTNPFPPQMRDVAPKRPPPSFYDEPSLAALQRHSTNEQSRPQITNMGIPQHPPTLDHQYMMKLPPGIGAQQQDRPLAPPPGFGPPPQAHRQPPSFANQPLPFAQGNPSFGAPQPQPQLSQQQQQQQRGMVPPHMYGGHMPPQGPPGFFGVANSAMQGPMPPGFGGQRHQEAFLIQQGHGMGGKEAYGGLGSMEQALLEEYRLRGVGRPQGGFGM
ncbi:hypothetical protein H2201_006080 [Coniosporium apollinis]|uniref:Uncharacterized protein n=1 Tax=Coniosporium apollinis TaxID=61459 RepID=A0ABQ9NN14_9PEZI|nr:hypothetical protein H2201_006080 [Coniosporium apollinis]